MPICHVSGNLLDQDVEVIVNAWNRNLIPWWLLLPQGISGAIKKHGGLAPFKELRKFGVLPLGGAALTSAGRLPYKAIIHVAGIGHNWRSSESSIRSAVRSAISLAEKQGFGSIGFPLIGAGTGGGSEDRVEAMIHEEIERSFYAGRAVIVRYSKNGIQQTG
jgi:O-acetyl-ADP-ribose deacetylase (regulator of RNase III)